MAWQDCQRRITKHHPVCRVANPVFSPELSVRSVTKSYQVRSSRGDNNGFMNAKLYHGDALVATSKQPSFSVVEHVPSVRPAIPQSLVRVQRNRTWLQLLPRTCESDPQVALKPNRIACQGVAVEPLKNLSGDSAQEYLVDGMTESIIGRLSGIHELRVISRTSSMRFKDTKLSVPEIALGLD